MSPIKEPGYFAPEYGLQNYLSRWEGYLTLYRGVQEETAIDEATVCYLLSRTAAQNIAAPGVEVYAVSQARPCQLAGVCPTHCAAADESDIHWPLPKSSCRSRGTMRRSV
jgi:hypothetical protein